MPHSGFSGFVSTLCTGLHCSSCTSVVDCTWSPSAFGFWWLFRITGAPSQPRCFCHFGSVAILLRWVCEFSRTLLGDLAVARRRVGSPQHVIWSRGDLKEYAPLDSPNRKPTPNLSHTYPNLPQTYPKLTLTLIAPYSKAHPHSRTWTAKWQSGRWLHARRSGDQLRAPANTSHRRACSVHRYSCRGVFRGNKPIPTNAFVHSAHVHGMPA